MKTAAGWRTLIPKREDWLAEADGVLIVLLFVLGTVAGGGLLSTVGLAAFALVTLHFRMLDRRLLRERSEICGQALDRALDAMRDAQIVLRNELHRRRPKTDHSNRLN